VNKQKQSGFSHMIIIVVILSVAIMGTLGYVFWQNFLRPKTSDAQISTVTSTKTPKKTDTTTSVAKIDSTADWNNYSRNGITLKYPKSWSTLDNDGPNPYFYSSYFGNQEIQLGRDNLPNGFIGLTLGYSRNGDNLGRTSNDGPDIILSSSTNLTDFLKYGHGMTGAKTAQETIQIGGVQATRLLWNDMITPWAVKTSTGVYEFDYQIASDINKTDAEKSVNQIFDTVKFTN